MTISDLDALRSNQCLDIGRNAILVSRRRMQIAKSELVAADHRLEQAMDGLKHLVKELTSPVPGDIRSDSEGDGVFGAPRGIRLHTGIDLLCTKGDEVVAPHDGLVNRVVMPYKGDDRFHGLEIVNDVFISHVLYIDPLDIVNMDVVQGELIGTAQNIQEKYTLEMKQHIHWRLFINPKLFVKVLK